MYVSAKNVLNSNFINNAWSIKVDSVFPLYRFCTGFFLSSLRNLFPPLFKESSTSFSDRYHVWLPLVNRYEHVSLLRLHFDIDQHLFVANWSAKTSWPLGIVVYHLPFLSTLSRFLPLSTTQVCLSSFLSVIFSSTCMNVPYTLFTPTFFHTYISAWCSIMEWDQWTVYRSIDQNFWHG